MALLLSRLTERVFGGLMNHMNHPREAIW